MTRKLTWFLASWMMATALCACGSDDGEDGDGKNICEEACDKVETCPSQQCTLNLEECDGATRTVAECVLETSCDQLASCLN